MPKIRLLATSTLTASALASLPAMAEISANVALTTDYVFRGVSQTQEDPAIQGGFDYAHDSGFYVGVWGSNVDFNEGTVDDADLELDAYLGFSSELPNGLGYDIGVLRYIYPGTDTDLDFNEFHVGLSYGIVSGSIHYSNDVLATDERGIYYTVGVTHPLPQDFGINASIGYYDFNSKVFGPDNPDSYMDWKIGITKPLFGVDLELSYTDTNSDAEELFGKDLADARAVFTVSKEF